MLKNKIRRLLLIISKKKYGFTLVELIVVITILGILGAVGFLSFQGHNLRARDSSRATDLSNITKSLSVFQTERGILPKPTESINIAATGIVIGYQGKAGDSVLEQINYNDGGVDPLDGKPYTYFANKNGTKFQLMGFYEDKESGGKISDSSTGGYAGRFPTLAGDKLGVMFSPTYEKPVHEVSYFASTGSIDVATTTGTFQSYISEDFIIQGSSSVLNIIENIASPTILSTPFPANCSEVMSSGKFTGNGSYVISTDGGTTTSTVTCNMVSTSSVLVVGDSGEIEAPKLCTAESVTVNTHNYNVPELAWGGTETNLASSAGNISVNNGTFSYTISPTCTDGSIVPGSESTTLVSCNTGFAATGNECVPSNLLVLTAGTWNANLGGLSGADAKCLSDLNTNDWKYKGGGTLTSGQVKAFLCDSTSCQKFQASTTYAYASSGNSAYGGATFTSDGSGYGPGDSQNWSDSTAFGINAYAFAGTNSSDHSYFYGTPNASDSRHCTNWTLGTGGYGYWFNTNATDRGRWYAVSSSSCQTLRRLICIVER